MLGSQSQGHVVFLIYENTTTLGVPAGRSSHFFLSPVALTRGMIKCLLAGPELTEQVPLARYGIIIGGNLASSNTNPFFFFFFKSPLPSPAPCLLPSSLLAPFLVKSWTSQQLRGILVIAQLCTPYPLHRPFFLSSSHLERRHRLKVTLAIHQNHLES